MTKTNLLLFVLFFYGFSISLDITKRCVCSEYDEYMCKLIQYCSYFEKQCVPLICSEQSQLLCELNLLTDYKCKWNDTTDTCEDHEYECTELQSVDCYLNQYTKQCQYIDGSCQKWQSCSSATNAIGCNTLKCSVSVGGGCGEPHSGIDCSGTSLETCFQSNGEGKQCQMNNQNECQSLNAYPRSCSELNNFSNMCKAYCQYDTTSNQCVEQSCSMFKSSMDCSSLINLIDFTVTPCVWKSETCQEAALEDLIEVTCTTRTSFNGKWNNESSNCQQCSQTEDNPLFFFQKAFIDSLNNNYILLTQFLIIIIVI